MTENRVYIAIDLKSFYASVECIERGLDPLNTNLVVADGSRTDKTICLAVSPSLKSYGIPGRPRLFEVKQKVKEINQNRMKKNKFKPFSGSSYSDIDLKNNDALALDYITAVPRMAHYIECSTKIYSVYLKYIAPEDIHVYSIDEVFMDVTSYLNTYQLTAHQLAMTMIKDVLKTTGITATAGIGTNLYLAKVAMDIVAKKMPADKDGVRIAELNEISYRKLLWTHEPITDFWRVGAGYARRLEQIGLYTMGDVALCSLGKAHEHHNEDLLYKTFGVNAELLIDHAWGYEPCTIKDIKAYKPENNSLGSGQVLHKPYSNKKARLVVQEMIDLLSLDLVSKRLMTDQLILTIGYDRENIDNDKIKYKGEVTSDHYGRTTPKHAHGTINLNHYTSSTRELMRAIETLFDRITDKQLLVRRINITACRVLNEDKVSKTQNYDQLSLFTDYEAMEKKENERQKELEKEKNLQKAILNIKAKYGKNSVLKGMNLEEDATAKDRNSQIGGHKA